MQNMKNSLHQIKIMNSSGIRSHDLDFYKRSGCQTIPTSNYSSRFRIIDLVKTGTNAKVGARKET